MPAELDGQRLCLPHFLSVIEQTCAELRRETAAGNFTAARQAEIADYIASHGELVARTATSGARLPDELKARVLNTFLTLMNLRENMERAVERSRVQGSK